VSKSVLITVAIFLLAGVAVLCLPGRGKESAQDSQARKSPGSVATFHGAKQMSTVAESVSAKLMEEASQALKYINEEFVSSDCTLLYGSTWTICTRSENLSVVGDKLVMSQDFEQHRLNAPTTYSHESQTASLKDLDSDSLHLQDDSFEGATDRMRLDCKNTTQCVSSEESGASGDESPVRRSQSSIGIGDFSRKDGKEVESYLRRLLAFQQGDPLPPIVREPTEEMAESFIADHYAPSLQMGDGITASNRTLRVQGDTLVETADLTQYGRPGLLVVTVNLKDLDDLMAVSGREVGLMCKAPSQTHPKNCFSASTGQSSSDRSLKGVSDGEGFLKMLKRLTVLH
jgi:hypothetical protein